MSFQDFGGNRPASRTGPAPPGAFAAAAGRQGVAKSSMSAVGGNSRGNTVQGVAGGVGRGGVGGGGLGQISESLTQYQRNVGILEKIAQSILSSGNSNHRGIEELKMQYHVQVDVIRQLEEKVRTQLQHMQAQSSSSTSTAKSTLVKLQRDFERVEARAAQWKAAVERSQSDATGNAASRGVGGGPTPGGAGNPASLAAQPQPHNAGQQDPYQLMQMQVQQDRLNEEIMREREEEIRNINRGMIQVNEIYKDLAHIVGQQQEQVDQIETQMEDAKANAQSGLQQVEKANEKFGNANCTIS